MVCGNAQVWAIKNQLLLNILSSGLCQDDVCAIIQHQIVDLKSVFYYALRLFDG